MNVPVGKQFVSLDAEGRLKAIDEAYGDRALLLCSMQRTGGVLMHMIHRLSARTVILFVDTQFHFPETLEVRDRFIERYGLDIRTVYPELSPDEQRKRYGNELYNFVDGQPECCEMRKEKPFLKAARQMGIKAVIIGLMRSEGGARAGIEPIGHDPRLDCPTFYPLFDWTHEQIEAYSKEHELPVHALHAQGYPSIGCAPCTTPVRPGEDQRAGRWRHLRASDGSQPQFCNINFSDMGEGI